MDLTGPLLATVAGWTVIATNFWLRQIVAVWWPSSGGGLARRPSCTVVRPCTGAPSWLQPSLDALAACLTKDDQLLIAVASTDDPAYGAVAAWARRHDHLDVTVVLGGPETPNAKVARLSAAETLVRHPVVVMLDDDVWVDRALLDELVVVADRTQGAAWSPPFEGSRGVPTSGALGPGPTLADRASAAVLGASSHAFVALGGLPTGGDPTLVGKACALHHRARMVVGPFASLGHLLGEDQELAHRLCRAAVPVTMIRHAARSLACGRSWREVVERYTRWIWVVRAQRPWLLPTYPLLILAWLPLLIGWSALAWSGAATASSWPRGLDASSSWPWLAIAILTSVRLVLAISIDVRLGTGRGLRLAWDALWGEFVLWSAFAKALGAPKLSWRGRPLTLERGRLCLGPPWPR